jgi:hypothetical protein
MKGMEDLGHQVLGVYGGQLKLFGMPGGEATPSWVRLSSTAQAGDKSISVTGDVSKWPTGGRVRLSSCEHKEGALVSGFSLLAFLPPGVWLMMIMGWW